MKELPSEILIYVQKTRKYFNENKEIYDYFLKDVDEELFFKYLAEISEKNYAKTGNPELTKIQFEILNKTVRAICVIKKPLDSIWWEDGIFGTICLN